MRSPADTDIFIPTEFEADGINFVIFDRVGGRELEDPQAYVFTRIARENGQRISGMGLTVTFLPIEGDDRDTTIAHGLCVGRGVVIGAHAQIGECAALGNNVEIGSDCTLGRHVTVASNSKIGAGNYLPDLSQVGKDVVIPDNTFVHGDPRVSKMLPGANIDQKFVNDFVAHKLIPMER